MSPSNSRSPYLRLLSCVSLEALEGRQLFCYQLTGGAPEPSATVTQAMQSLGINATSLAPANDPWSNADVGSTGAAGSTDIAGGAFTVKGSGADIFGTADGFQFVYQKMTGDGQIVARVDSLTNTDSWAKAGLQMRSSLSASASDASMFTTPGHGVSFQYRKTDGGASGSVTPGTSSVLPVWLMLVRRGQVFSGFRSTDGTLWSRVGYATVPTGVDVYVGLALTSHQRGTLATAAFSNVQFTGVNPNPPSNPNPNDPLTFTRAADQPMSRSESAGAAVNGKMYVFGGHFGNLDATTRSDVFDPATGAWSPLAPMPEALTHTARIVDGNLVYLFGGFLGAYPGPGTKHVWVYDTTTNLWSSGPDLPEDRGAGAAGLVGRQAFVFGGATRVPNTTLMVDHNDNWMLDLGPTSSQADDGITWTPRAVLPLARNHLGGVAVGGLVYAVGGQFDGRESGADQTRVDAYNPVTDTWTQRASLPVATGHLSANTFEVNGRIITVGGVNPGAIESAAVMEYNPTSDSWRLLGSIPAGRRAPVAVYLNGRLYVTGGDNRHNGEGITATTWISSLYS